MHTIEHISIAILTIISALTLFRAARIIDAIRRRDLITDDIAGCCESLGFVGCSVICSGVSSLKHIEELLGQEYDRYEVIITLDSEQYVAEFMEIISRYRMIRVNCSANDELPSAKIKALYRSRQRSFRRLILIDKPQAEPYDELDAATAVASYNFLLPIGHHTHLCPKAIECIAITLSELQSHDLELLYSMTSDGYIFRRDAIIANGGFSPHIIRQIPTSARLGIYTPLTFSSRPHPPLLPSVAILIALLCTIDMAAGHTITIASVMTIALIITLARYISILATPTNCSLQIILCIFRKMVSIFRVRKFLFS